MNCDQFRDLIHDLAREDASADAGVVIDALAHAESCPTCDALLREAEQITLRLHSLAVQHRLDATPAHVEATLLQAFRRQHAPAQGLRVASWLSVSAVGIAAAGLLAILLTSHHPGVSPAPPRVPESAPRQTNQPSIAPRTAWANYAADGETEEQAAAAYIPLSADFDPSWLEQGAIVRVVLSQPALESMGLPVTPDGNGEMVADMVVSNEGTPEAIRIVNWQESDIQ